MARDLLTLARLIALDGPEKPTQFTIFTNIRWKLIIELREALGEQYKTDRKALNKIVKEAKAKRKQELGL